MRKLASFAVAGGIAVSLLVGGPSTAQAATTCTGAPHALPTDPTQTQSDEVLGLGGDGHLAVGQVGYLPAYWKDGVLSEVPLPPDYVRGQVNAVNKSGLMVGTIGGSYDDPKVPETAFRYRIGWAAVELYPTGEEATAVNDAGYATVQSETSDTGWVYRSDGHLARTLHVPGSLFVKLAGINNANQVVGSATLDVFLPTYHTSALAWASNGQLRELRPKNRPPVNVYGQGIDDRGQIIADQQTNNEPSLEHGLFWRTPRRLLRSIPDRLLPLAISPTSTTVVGVFLDGPGGAAVWRGGSTTEQLAGLVPGGTTTAYAVSDDGRIAGTAVNANGRYAAVIWTCARS